MKKLTAWIINLEAKRSKQIGVDFIEIQQNLAASFLHWKLSLCCRFLYKSILPLPRLWCKFYHNPFRSKFGQIYGLGHEGLMCWAHFELKIKIIIADLSASFLSSSTSPQSNCCYSWRYKREDQRLEGVLMTLPVLFSTLIELQPNLAIKYA